MPAHKQVGKFWNIATNKETKTTDIYIYGTITKWAWKELGEVSSQAFIKELNTIEDTDTINLNINSGGGDVFEAHAIANTLKKYAASNGVKTIAFVDGVAASAASYLAVSCEETRMCIGSKMMIHNVSGSARGEAKDFRATADLLDKIKNSIIDVYMTKSTLSREKLSDLMDKTTWMNPEEALENGLIDKVEDFSNFKNLSNMGDMSNFEDFEILNSYENAPEGIIDDLKNRGKTPKPATAIPIDNNKSGGKKMTREELKNNHPELYNQIFNEGKEAGKTEGITNERARLQKLDNLNIKNGGSEIVAKAKYEEVKNAEEVAMEILNSEEYQAGQELGQRGEDFENSGAGNVKQPTPAPTNSDDELDEEILNAANAGYGTV